jgi:hypothetical protein
MTSYYKAIKFYADPHTYVMEGHSAADASCPLEEDCGRRAREALAQPRIEALVGVEEVLEFYAKGAVSQDLSMVTTFPYPVPGARARDLLLRIHILMAEDGVEELTELKA